VPDDNETQAQAAFRDAQQMWRTALEGHRKAVATELDHAADDKR
jgi:hypothetical protein